MNLKLSVIQSVIDDMGPLPGAREFIEWLRERYQLIILSDTFYEFGMPLNAPAWVRQLFSATNWKLRDDQNCQLLSAPA